MIIRLVHIAIAAAALLAALASCSNDSCSDNGSSLPLATFHINGTQQSIPGLSIMGIGVPGDSLLADNKSISEVYLPLRASTTSTSYALWRSFTSGDNTVTVRDTITLDYKAVPFFHSAECGAMFNFDIETVTHTTHGIDSVVMLTTHVTNSRTPAMRIYFTNLQQ